MNHEKNASVRIAAQKVVMAWKIEGSHPIYHREMKKAICIKWPTLYRAIMELVKEEML